MWRLYEQAKRDQWNAATDIDWTRPLEGDGGLIADDLVDIHGTRFWDRLSDQERVEVNRRVSQWRLSTLVHGEHGALLVCSQMVENVHGQDAKLFQATQVVDEARHNEVLQPPPSTGMWLGWPGRISTDNASPRRHDGVHRALAEPIRARAARGRGSALSGPSPGARGASG
jgi:hypothetical protein